MKNYLFEVGQQLADVFYNQENIKPLNQNRMKDKGCACYGSNYLHKCFCKDYQPIKTKSKKSYRKKTKSE